MRRRVNGFTLIEAMVAALIIGVLIAILLPAVQAAREAARRASCMQNLRQLGIALSSYETALSSMPFAGNINGFSAHSMMLPFCEQTALYHSINFNVNPYSSQNRTVGSTSLSIFACPSDSAARGPGGPASYPVCIGFGAQRNSVPEASSNGIFVNGFEQPIRIAGIADGMSNTVAMSEWLVSPPPTAPDPEPKRQVYITPMIRGPEKFDAFIAACLGSTALAEREAKGLKWLEGQLSMTVYNHNITPNGKTCSNDGYAQEGAYTAGSLHGTSSNCLFADGHVVSARETISIEVWRALSTRSGGEIVSAGSY
ncbi:DUF1559 domain-containing protein [Isosphaeraceae bacterium EP7]